MGLYDRDYMREAPLHTQHRVRRREDNYSTAATRSIPEWFRDQFPMQYLRATWVICFAVLAVSGAWFLAIENSQYWGHAAWLATHCSLDHTEWGNGRYYTLVTHALLYPHYWHGFVMLAGLFVFTGTTEVRTGTVQVVMLFVVATIAGALIHLFLLSEASITLRVAAVGYLSEHGHGKLAEVCGGLLDSIIESARAAPLLVGPAAATNAMMVLALLSRPGDVRRRDDFPLWMLAGLFVSLDWTGLLAFEGYRVSVASRLGGIAVALGFVGGRAVLRGIRQAVEMKPMREAA